VITVKMDLYDEQEIAFFNSFYAALQETRRFGNGPKDIQPVDPNKPRDVTQAYYAATEQELTKESISAQQIAAGPLTAPAVEVKPPIVVEAKVAIAISAFKAYAEKNGIPAARAVLDKVGVKRAGDITEAQVPALLEAIK
jgi:hypothetical protein